MSIPKYELSQELSPPHSSDVKAVIPLPDDRIATASRDQSVGIWKYDGNSFQLQALLGGHEAYVNSLAYIPSSGGDEEYIASGGNSTMILLHSLKTNGTDTDTSPKHTLIGHSLNVSTLEYSSKRQKLISGSWDRTARVWSRSRKTLDDGKRGDDCSEKEKDGWECEMVLEEHQEAVWGVLAIDQGPNEGCWLTSSADRLIYLWSEQGELLKRFKGSPEPARGLTILPQSDGEHGFASACNDGVVRKWNWSGSITALLRGHTDYVYSVATGNGENGRLVSCGEDHSARIWQDDGTSSQMLHPCQTVWTVGQLDNGDVITGGSDGKVRVWTTEESRFAAQDVREAYEARVSEAMRNYEPFSNNADGEGERDPITIDIDISDDAPPIPLVFHPGVDDPREIAIQFGGQHGMSENYINQIEQFIRAHVS